MDIGTGVTLLAGFGSVLGTLILWLRRALKVLESIRDVTRENNNARNDVETKMTPKITALEQRMSELEAATDRRYRSMAALQQRLGHSKKRTDRTDDEEEIDEETRQQLLSELGRLLTRRQTQDDTEKDNKNDKDDDAEIEALFY